VTEHVGVGLGTDVVLTGDGIVGGALAWDSGFPHVAVFATEERNDRQDLSVGRRIASARQRRDNRIY